MITTTHAIFSYIIFRKFSKSKVETFAIVSASILPDVEVLFWVGMDFINKLFRLNPFNINYNDLLRGSGISFWYWPYTLITNSVFTTATIAIILIFLSKNYRVCIICWFVVLFHILLDSFTHKTGSMFFWPLSTIKYLGLFDFQGLPKYIIVIEQIVSFSLLFTVLAYRKIVIMLHGK